MRLRACCFATAVSLLSGVIAAAESPYSSNLTPAIRPPWRIATNGPPAAIDSAPLSALDPAADSLTPMGDCDPACQAFDWSKVPSTAGLPPRLGSFIINPDRPGYYSVLDVLRGCCRDQPPKFPYPPISLNAGSFFDADYRYLDDPKNCQHDWLDCLKRRHPNDNWMLSTGGEFRYRLMDELGSRLTAVDNNYHLIRTRVYGDVWYQDRLRFYIEMLDAHSFNQSLPPLAIDNNTADFLNLFVDVKALKRWDNSTYLRIGRQELLYGDQRLVSPLEWANTRRTFQGVKLFRRTEKWDADLFWVKPVPVNRNQLDWWDNAQDFYGMWTTYKPKKGTTRDFYALQLLQRRPVATGAGGLPGGFNITTFGTRWAGDHDGTWLYDFEGMIQTGLRANSGLTAYAAVAGLGYRAKNLRMNPTAWANYEYASGTPDPAVAGRNRTFNPLFPFGHHYHGFIDLVGRQNIHDFNVQVSLHPAPFILTAFQYHHFALASPRDALFNAAGAVLREDPTGASGRHVGDEFDFIANVHVSQHMDVFFGFSYLVPGQFLRNAPGGVPRDPKLYYLQYSYKW